MTSQFNATFPFQFSDQLNTQPFYYPAHTAAKVIGDNQVASLHTVGGVQLYQFLGNDLIDLRYSREQNQPSQCEMNTSTAMDYGKLPDIHPLLHWVSVWDADTAELMWTGPVTRSRVNEETSTISARDMSELFKYTRNPLSKKWQVEDPADIAAELVKAMIDWHGVKTRPIVRHDPYGDRFDYTSEADKSMLADTMSDLTGLGLVWTVVAGTPILGPMPRTPVAALGTQDFTGKISLVRDGSRTFNDVLLRAADSKTYAKVPMGGRNFQTIVNLDSVSGASNADRAAKQHARFGAKIHQTIELPDDTALHPNAPLTIQQCIPSSRITVEAYDLLVPMEITGVDVSFTPQTCTVSPRVVAVDDDLPELIEIQQRTSMTGVGA